MADMSVEDITMRANQVTNESLESTRRILQMAEESRRTGVNTIDMLGHQGGQLKRTEEGLDQINRDMKKAQKNLADLTWGDTGSAGEGGDAFVVSRKPSGIHNGQANQQQPLGDSESYIKSVTNDAREDEMEENLYQVESITRNLKDIAMKMGSELDKQNTHIKHITEKAENNKVRISDANKLIK